MYRIALAATLLVAQAGGFAQSAPSAQARELIYCAEHMTHEEREAYRVRMQAAPTPQEKEQVRTAHRVEMQARAASQGAPGQCEVPGRNAPVGREGARK